MYYQNYQSISTEICQASSTKQTMEGCKFHHAGSNEESWNLPDYHGKKDYISDQLSGKYILTWYSVKTQE